MDALTDRLIKGIEEVSKRTPEINEKVLEEYVNLFLDFFSNLGKVSGVSVDLEKVRSKLFEYGFFTLTHQYVGRLEQDFEVSSLVARAFNLVVNDFHQGNLQKG